MGQGVLESDASEQVWRGNVASAAELGNYARNMHALATEHWGGVHNDRIHWCDHIKQSRHPYPSSDGIPAIPYAIHNTPMHRWIDVL